MLVDAPEIKLTGQGLAGFQRPDGLVMMFARVLILRCSFNSRMIRDGQVERGGGGNKSVSLRPRVVGAAQFVSALNKTKAAPCVDQDGR